MFNAFCNWFGGWFSYIWNCYPFLHGLRDLKQKKKKAQALHVFDDNVTGTYINLIDLGGRVTSFYFNGDVDVKPYEQHGVVAYDKKGRVVAYQGKCAAFTVERLYQQEETLTTYLAT